MLASAISVSLLLGSIASQPTKAYAPQQNNETKTLETFPETMGTPTEVKVKVKTAKTTTLVKANTQITPEKLSAWLGDSPLAPYSELILKSPHWSTIIGICAIEQYKCQRAPNWNYWGMMVVKNGVMSLQKFDTAEQAIAEITRRMELYEQRWGSPIENWRGKYCASACSNWESTVIKIKKEVESL